MKILGGLLAAAHLVSEKKIYAEKDYFNFDLRLWRMHNSCLTMDTAILLKQKSKKFGKIFVWRKF